MERRRHAAGFTLIELLVSVALVALLIAVSLPALAATRGATRSTACAANLRQVVVGWHALLLDRDQVIPNTRHLIATEPQWDALMGETLSLPPLTFTSTPRVTCPETERRHPGLLYANFSVGYPINSRWRSGTNPGDNAGERWDAIAEPSRYPCFSDGDVIEAISPPFMLGFFGEAPAIQDDWGLGFPHDRRGRTAMGDGHVTWTAPENLTETDGYGVPVFLVAR